MWENAYDIFSVENVGQKLYTGMGSSLFVFLIK